MTDPTPKAQTFQPTHPHGVRPIRKPALFISRKFQPTHPHGVRHMCRTELPHTSHVSTHAPARGATQQGAISYTIYNKFQPTHPHGVRLCFLVRCHYWEGFNPRTRTGCDRESPCHQKIRQQFQPTHPHGVRRRTKRRSRTSRVFQPTHPHGVRLISDTSGTHHCLVSTHAPARGATQDYHGMIEI